MYCWTIDRCNTNDQHKRGVKKHKRRIYTTHYVTATVDHNIWYVWLALAEEAEGQLMINSQNIDVRVEMHISPPSHFIKIHINPTPIYRVVSNFIFHPFIQHDCACVDHFILTDILGSTVIVLAASCADAVGI